MASKANQIASSGFSPIPKGAAARDLIGNHTETIKKTYGKTKTTSLEMLKHALCHEPRRERH
jgi:hypothetical protein